MAQVCLSPKCDIQSLRYYFGFSACLTAQALWSQVKASIINLSPLSSEEVRTVKEGNE